jgi:hypothetical protein
VCLTANVAPDARGGTHELVGFLERQRHGLLDEDRDSALQKRHRDVAVQFRWNSHDNGIDRIQQLSTVRAGARASRRSRLIGPFADGVDHSHERRVLEVGQNPRVMSAKVPDADDANPEP